MALIMNRVRCTWSGAVVGGGVTTFYLEDPDTVVTGIKNFFTALAPNLPSSAVITIPNSGDQIRDSDGQLMGGWTGTGGGTVTGSGNSAYSSGVGAYVVWGTPDVVGRRRVKGRSFIAPLGQGFASTDGTLNDTLRASLQSAADTFAGLGDVGVWHRPTPAAPTSGSWHLIIDAQVVDRVTALRSRRF